MKVKKRSKKLRLMLLLLFLTAISLSTAAYSWFSTNRTVYISELNIKVQAQGGIEISADAKKWETIINQENIIAAKETYANSLNLLPMTMEPVSTGKEVIDGKLQIYYGYTENYNNDYILLANKIEEIENEDESKFMAFDIFLKSDNDTNLYLANGSGAMYEGITPGIENSVRFAFLVQGTIEDKTDFSSAQNLNLATESTTYIWEPNYDTHSENGIKNASQVYGINVGRVNAEQIKYDGLINKIEKKDKVFVSQANAKKYPKLFKNVEVDYLTKNKFEENLQIFSLKAGITKVRIYIWIEGQDVDCENKSAIGNIIFNFQFTTNPA